MFLDYFALGLLIFVALVIFYGIIVIHDIPYEIAKEREHPTPRCHSLCRLGKFIHFARPLAIFVDLGNIMAQRTWLGISEIGSRAT